MKKYFRIHIYDDFYGELLLANLVSQMNRILQCKKRLSISVPMS